MSVKCSYCSHLMPTRNNVYGTICDKCKKYLKPEKKPQFLVEAEFRFLMLQNKLRAYISKIMNGDTNGN